MPGRPELDAAIRALVPINRLPPHDQHRIAAGAKILEFSSGQQVYVQGQSDPFVHYLLAGEIELSWNGTEVRRLSAHSKAARRALDTPGRKKLTVRAIDAVVIARFLRDTLDRDTAAAVLPAATRELEVSEIATEQASDWMTRMLQSPLFAGLPATNIHRIFGRMERFEVLADQVVIRQGQPGDYYYVIEHGYCEVTREIAGGRREIHLSDLGPGHAFGEAALVSGKPRDATVTMLTDGCLMRLKAADFDELIRQPVLSPLNGAQALAAADAGARWLDVRYPEEYARLTLRNSRNLPLTVLRLQSQRLPKDERYLVCSDEPGQSAVGAFLLVERGFQVEYLDEPLSALARSHPALVLSHQMADSEPSSIVAFPGPGMPDIVSAQTPNLEAPTMDHNMDHNVDQQQVNASFSNTIERIDRLYTQQEFEEASRQRVPVEAYADTSTGRALAEIIDDIEERHDAIEVDGSPDFEPASSEFIDFAQLEATAARAANLAPVLPQVMPIDTRQPLPASQLFADIAAAQVAPPPALDELGEIMADFQQRLRGHVDGALLERSMGIERRYQDKLQRVRHNAAAELRKREAVLRESLEAGYRKKELALRAHYKKLMALANRISQQKAQLQQARRQFEEKLVAVNALHRQVEEMRRQLREHLGPGLDREQPPQRMQG